MHIKPNYQPLIRDLTGPAFDNMRALAKIAVEADEASRLADAKWRSLTASFLRR